MTHAYRPPWPEAQTVRLRDLWPTMEPRAIAAEMGITERAVLAKARRLGLPFREIWRSEEQKERIRAMRREGVTLKEIAAREGVSWGVVAGISYRMRASAPRKSRERDLLRRAPPIVTEWTIDMLPKDAPRTCQYVFGSPLRFCTNKRAIIAGRVSMYCKEHGVQIKPTARTHEPLFP